MYYEIEFDTKLSLGFIIIILYQCYAGVILRCGI